MKHERLPVGDQSVRALQTPFQIRDDAPGEIVRLFINCDGTRPVLNIKTAGFPDRLVFCIFGLAFRVSDPVSVCHPVKFRSNHGNSVFTVKFHHAGVGISNEPAGTGPPCEFRPFFSAFLILEIKVKPHRVKSVQIQPGFARHLNLRNDKESEFPLFGNLFPRIREPIACRGKFRSRRGIGRYHHGKQKMGIEAVEIGESAAQFPKADSVFAVLMAFQAQHRSGFFELDFRRKHYMQHRVAQFPLIFRDIPFPGKRQDGRVFLRKRKGVVKQSAGSKDHGSGITGSHFFQKRIFEQDFPASVKAQINIHCIVSDGHIDIGDIILPCSASDGKCFYLRLHVFAALEAQDNET